MTAGKRSFYSEFNVKVFKIYLKKSVYWIILGPIPVLVVIKNVGPDNITINLNFISRIHSVFSVPSYEQTVSATKVTPPINYFY